VIVHVLTYFLSFEDEDPYVRKTAAVSVAKLHDINSSLVEEQGFLDSLKVSTGTR
jgi:vesicle coat complex subunit